MGKKKKEPNICGILMTDTVSLLNTKRRLRNLYRRVHRYLLPMLRARMSQPRGVISLTLLSNSKIYRYCTYYRRMYRRDTCLKRAAAKRQKRFLVRLLVERYNNMSRRLYFTLIYPMINVEYRRITHIIFILGAYVIIYCVVIYNN